MSERTKVEVDLPECDYELIKVIITNDLAKELDKYQGSNTGSLGIGLHNTIGEPIGGLFFRKKQPQIPNVNKDLTDAAKKGADL